MCVSGAAAISFVGGGEAVVETPRMHESSMKNGGSDDDFKSDGGAMYRAVFAVLTLVRSMPR